MADNNYPGNDDAFEPVPNGKRVPLYDAGTTVHEVLEPIRAEAAMLEAQRIRELSTLPSMQPGADELSEPVMKTEPMQAFHPVPPTVDDVADPVAHTQPVERKFRDGDTKRLRPQDAENVSAEDLGLDVEPAPVAVRGDKLGRGEDGEPRPRREVIFISGEDTPQEQAIRTRQRHDVIYIEPEETAPPQTERMEQPARERKDVMFTNLDEIAQMLAAAGVEGGETHTGDVTKEGSRKIKPSEIRRIGNEGPDSPSL